MFAIDDAWVWDMWFADDGDLFHLFFLHAPKSLGDPDLRHTNASIGHAVSRDLIDWERRADALRAGAVGEPDQTATWTGSVIQGPDGTWQMYYTGAAYLEQGNVQTICLATSPDLETWTKQGAILSADATWYETLGTSDWHEECWRDPWVEFGDDGMWHMYVTARSTEGELWSRGVIGHAVSTDSLHWTAVAPVSTPAGFAHVEVVQNARVHGQDIVLFSCTRDHVIESVAAARPGGEIWAAPRDHDSGSCDLASATPVAGLGTYCGRLIQDRAGEWQLFAFVAGDSESFGGFIPDPLPFLLAEGEFTPKKLT